MIDNNKGQRKKQREISFELPAPLPIPKNEVVQIEQSDQLVFKGVDGRDFKIWPDSHQGYYWTTEYDRKLKKRVNVLRVIKRKESVQP